MKAAFAWAMPSRWTFEIPPIADFVARHVGNAAVIVDPFAGRSNVGTHRNDLAKDGGMDAGAFCESLLADGVEADVVIFDPPYSPRQVADCYREAGRKATKEDTQNGALYSRARKPLARLLKPGGKALCFGWSTMGLSSKWPVDDLLIVRHGGAHNDTLCVAQVKPRGIFDGEQG